MFGSSAYSSSPAQDVVLTEGAVERSLRTDASTLEHPVLQVVTFRALQAVPSAGHPSPATSYRYRLTLSDGRHCMMALLASQLTHLVEAGTLTTGSIVRLLDVVVATVRDKRVVVILNLELVSPPRAIANEGHLEWRTQGSTPSASSLSPASSTHSPSFNLSALASALPETPTKSVFTFGAAASPPASTAPSPSSGFDLSPLAAALPSGSTHASPFRTFESTPPRVQASPKADDVGGFTPVANLNPYLSRWAIRVKVTAKGGVKHFQTAHGSGKLLAIDLMDVAGTEIRAVMFNEAVDKFESIIQQGNVYSIEKATLKVANKKFSRINNDYEITISPASVVEAVADTFPGLICHFAPLSDVREKKADDLLNTIGMITSVGDLTRLSTRHGTELEKRSLALTSREVSVELTLWGHAAASFEGSAGDVLGLKNVKVSEWQGRSLVHLSTTTMYLNPDVPAAHDLKQRWLQGQSLQGATQVSSYGSSRRFPAREKHKAGAVKTIEEIKALDVSSRSAFVVVNATVVSIKYDLSGNTYYRSCPNEACSRKVVDVGGSYRCAACNASFDHCQYRYVMSGLLMDHTGSLRATFFNDAGAALLGIPASEVADICENRRDARALKEVVDGALHKWRFKLRVTEESWGNYDKRLRATVMSATPLNYAAYGSDVTASISRLLAQQ